MYLKELIKIDLFHFVWVFYRWIMTGPVSGSDCCSGKEGAHEAVWSIPRMGYDEVDGVRLDRPEGKKFRRNTERERTAVVWLK